MARAELDQRVGDQVELRVHLARRYSQVGAGIVGIAVAIRVLVLPVSPGVRLLDAFMAAAALCIGLALLRLPSAWERHRELASVACAVALAVVAAIGLRAAAAQLPDFTLVAAVAFTAILVGLDVDSPRGSSTRTSSALNRAPWTPALAGTGAVVVIFIVLWVTTAPASTGLGSLVVVVAAMAGIKLLAAGGADRSLDRLDF